VRASDVYGRGASGAQQVLVAIKPVARTLARRAMQPYVGDVVEPLPPSVIEVRVVEKRPVVDELIPQVPAKRNNKNCKSSGALCRYEAIRNSVVRSADASEVVDGRSGGTNTRAIQQAAGSKSCPF